MSRRVFVCSLSKCAFLVPSLAVFLSIAPVREASAGFDCSGSLTFDFLAEEYTIYHHFEEVPGDAPFHSGRADAYFHSQASVFEHAGVFLWADFDLEAHDGIRHALLMIDIDLGLVGIPDTMTPDSAALRAEYIEKRGDDILFWGKALGGEAWIDDAYFDSGDRDAIEGGFNLVFHDPEGKHTGCRVIGRAHFTSEPTPASRRNKVAASSYEEPDPVEDEEYHEEDAGGCGGNEEEVATGCAEAGGEILIEGCAAAAASGCEGDTGEGSGCEGDTYDEASLASFKRMTRVLPQLGVVFLIGILRKRKKSARTPTKKG